MFYSMSISAFRCDNIVPADKKRLRNARPMARPGPTRGARPNDTAAGAIIATKEATVAVMCATNLYCDIAKECGGHLRK